MSQDQVRKPRASLGSSEGEELLVTPRQARVFVDEAAGI